MTDMNQAPIAATEDEELTDLIREYGDDEIGRREAARALAARRANERRA